MEKRTIRCASVDIEEKRWDVRLTFRNEAGDVTEELIASADAYFTDHSGIYFATAAEHAERT